MFLYNYWNIFWEGYLSYKDDKIKEEQIISKQQKYRELLKPSIEEFSLAKLKEFDNVSFYNSDDDF